MKGWCDERRSPPGAVSEANADAPSDRKPLRKNWDYEETLEMKTSGALLAFKLLPHQHFQEVSFTWVEKQPW